MTNDFSKHEFVLKPFNEDTWEEYEKCTFAFFPGCRLGAIDPEFLMRTYDAILARQPDTAIVLQCCESSVPDVWNRLGRPTFIMSCDECAQYIEENLSEIETISLKSFLDDPVPSQIAKIILENDDLSEEEKKENTIFLTEELKNIF